MGLLGYSVTVYAGDSFRTRTGGTRFFHGHHDQDKDVITFHEHPHGGIHDHEILAGHHVDFPPRDKDIYDPEPGVIETGV